MQYIGIARKKYHNTNILQSCRFFASHSTMLNCSYILLLCWKGVWFTQCLSKITLCHFFSGPNCYFCHSLVQGFRYLSRHNASSACTSCLFCVQSLSLLSTLPVFFFHQIFIFFFGESKIGFLCSVIWMCSINITSWYEVTVHKGHI